MPVAIELRSVGQLAREIRAALHERIGFSAAIALGEGLDGDVSDVLEATVPERGHRVVFLTCAADDVAEEDRHQIAELVLREALLDLDVPHAVREELVRNAVEGDAIGRPHRRALEEERAGSDVPAHAAGMGRERIRDLLQAGVERTERVRMRPAVLANIGEARPDLLPDSGEPHLHVLRLLGRKLLEALERLVTAGLEAAFLLRRRADELTRAQRREETEHLAPHRRCVLEALLSLEGQRAIHTRDDLHRQIGGEIGDRRRGLRGCHDERLGLGARVIEALPGKCNIHACPDREDVGAPVDLGDETKRLLRSDVGRRTDCRSHARRLDPGACLTHARDTEVEHLHVAGVGDEDVPGLDVAMDDADLVALREEVEHGLEDAQRLLERDLTAGLVTELV